MSGRLQTMRTARPAVGSAEAAELAHRHFGVQGTASALDSERDRNFRIDASDGRRYTLKIWNHSQDAEAIEFIAAMLDGLQAAPQAPPTPGLCRTRDGALLADHTTGDGKRHRVCLMTWLDGIFLRDVASSPAVLESLGSALARLDRALAHISSPAARRELVWDIRHVGRLGDMAQAIDSNDLRALILDSLDACTTRTLPRLAGLRTQVIHNDFNPDNVLLDAQDQRSVSGVIDFGDALEAPLVCELGVACAYHLSGHGDPVRDLLPLISAYHAVYPLRAEELELIPGLVGARLLCSVLITTRMAQLHPHNREYLMVDTRAAGRCLAQLDTAGVEESGRRLRAACMDDASG